MMDKMIQAVPDWYFRLKEEKITQRTLDSLDEYSISIPTGQQIGKIWKQDINFFKQYGKVPIYIIREYIECDDPTKIGIDNRRAVIVEAKQR